MTVNNAVAIAIDNGELAITGTATQGNSGSTSVTISNGGTLSLGDNVSLNVAAMEIILGTDDVASIDGVAPTANDGAIITGSGTISPLLVARSKTTATQASTTAYSPS